MNRRELMLLLAGSTAARSLNAQQKAIPVVGAFRQGLAETGYVEGQNVAIEYRWAEGHYDRLPALAADLISHRVDVLAGQSDASAHAAKSATSSIPIVFVVGADPVAA